MDNYSPGQLAAFWAAVGAIATVAAAGAAILTLIALRRDSRDRSRPIMSADLQPIPLSHGSSELVVTNLGASVARNVRVIFDPELPELIGAAAQGKVTPFLRNRYLDALPTVAPGRKLRNVYSVGVPGPGDERVNDEPTPSDVLVRFDYQDAHGRKYSDEYPLTLGMLRNQTESSPSGGKETYAKRTVTALEHVAKALARDS